MSGRQRLGGRQRGVAAVEMGIVLGLLAIIVFGITELGRAMYQYDALTKSARAAARYLAVYDSADAAVQGRARCVAVFGNPDCAAAGVVPAVPGLSVANVAVAVGTAGAPGYDASLQGVETGMGTMDLVRVTIGAPATPYTFVSVVSFVIPDIEFGPISATMPKSFF
ncbi:pilus assembly protein [Burkholderiaceae bacterium FT117]|uniref:TadE/TadG family type IV pilus assembly protein n=1 Tax=Zeimonas sediminis TaxID=2944268 RepID=UPI0023430BF1|nr:TadE/TadG family type IV pilus assembly protein [Zeimonas sediminis]MCM5572082.1 pilus assembly protein [Zeimonas sediminis]